MDFDPNNTNAQYRTQKQIALAQQVELTRQFMAFDPDRASGWVLGQRGNVPLVVPFEGHIMTFGASGSGKGTSVAIPNLLMHRGNAVSFETDKATFDATWFYRKNVLGQRIRVIDPSGITGFKSDRVNLLAEVRRHGDRDLYDHALSAVHALFGEVAERSAASAGDNQIFSQSAADIVIAHVLYMCSERNRFPDEALSFDNLRQHLASFGMGGERDLAPPMQEAIDGSHSFKGAYLSAINHLTNLRRDNRNITQYGVFFSVESPLGVVNNPKIAAVSQDATFSFDELAQEPTTLYVIMPNASDYKKASPWFRLLFDRLQASFKPDGRGGSSFTQDTRTLFMIDEFQNLGRVPDIAGAFDTVRKHGITLWTLTQSIDALEDVYGKGVVGNMLSNATAVQILGMGHGKTLQYASERMGRDVLFLPQVQYGRNKTEGDTVTVGLSEALNFGESVTHGEATTVSEGSTFTDGIQGSASWGESSSDDEHANRQTKSESWNVNMGRNESRSYQSGQSAGTNKATTKNSGTSQSETRSDARSSSETITGSVTFTPQLVNRFDPAELETLLAEQNMQLVFVRTPKFSLRLIERPAEYFRVPYFAARAGVFNYAPSPLPELVRDLPRPPVAADHLPSVAVSTAINDVLVRKPRPVDLDSIKISPFSETVSEGKTLAQLWSDMKLSRDEAGVATGSKRKIRQQQSHLVKHIGVIKPAYDSTIDKIRNRGRVTDGVWSKVDGTKTNLDQCRLDIEGSLRSLKNKGKLVNNYENELEAYRCELLSRFNELSMNPKRIRDFVQNHLEPLSRADGLEGMLHPVLHSPPKALEEKERPVSSQEELLKILETPVEVTDFQYPGLPGSPSRPRREQEPEIYIPAYDQRLPEKKLRLEDGSTISFSEVDRQLNETKGMRGFFKRGSNEKRGGYSPETLEDMRTQLISYAYGDITDGLGNVRKWRHQYGQWLDNDRQKAISYSERLGDYKERLTGVTETIPRLSARIDQRWKELAPRLDQLNAARETLNAMQINHHNIMAENPRWEKIKLLLQCRPKPR